MRNAEVIPGSDAVWIGAIGPAVSMDAGTATLTNCAKSDQIAATLLTALGVEWRSFDAGIGAPLMALPRH